MGSLGLVVNNIVLRTVFIMTVYAIRSTCHGSQLSVENGNTTNFQLKEFPSIFEAGDAYEFIGNNGGIHSRKSSVFV